MKGYRVTHNEPIYAGEESEGDDAKLEFFSEHSLVHFQIKKFSLMAGVRGGNRTAEEGKKVLFFMSTRFGGTQKKEW